jgi:hypothetical protein
VARYFTHELGECNPNWVRFFWPRSHHPESNWVITFQDRGYWLPLWPVIIGSAPDSAICVHDPNVSGKHAELQVELERVHLLDLGSSSGILVDGEPIQETWLRGREAIEIGALRFSVLRFGRLD